MFAIVSAGRPLRWRSAIAVAAVAWVLTAVVHCGPARAESDTPKVPHPLLTSLGSAFAINVDHPQLVDAHAQCHHHEQFAAAALPRAATALVTLGVVVAVLAVEGSSAQPVVLAARGPPFAAGNVFTGQDLLTRFCLARR